MAEPNCHYCDRLAEAECPTCGRLYCREHGEDVCLRCLAPEAAAPTAMAYRGAVLALIVGSVVAIFLAVRPPESESAGDEPRVLATSTPSFATTATATPEGAGRPGTPTPSATQATATSPTAVTTPVQTYTIQEGDTLSGLAERFNTTVEELLAMNPGLTEDLQIGTEIRVPAAQ